MPIQVTCPGCNRKLRAKDKLAGRIVKCPKCGTAIKIGVPDTRESRVEKADAKLIEECLRSLGEGDLLAAAPLIRNLHLWLVNVGKDAHQPLCGKVEGFDVMIAFTTLEHSQKFADASPEMLDAKGSLPMFAVEGQVVLEQLPESLGLLFNPESDDAILLSAKEAVALNGHLKSNAEKAKLKVHTPTPEQRDANGDPVAVAMRKSNVRILNELGFYPAERLPLPEIHRELRPEKEIASRTMALASLFAWGSAPPEAVPDEMLQSFIIDNDLQQWLTPEEKTICEMDREPAQQQHGSQIGWRLENMWPLCWVLGFEMEPDMQTGQIPQEVTQEMFFGYLGGLQEPLSQLLDKIRLRDADQVSQREDLFYCAHNAVRSAQLGSGIPTVPDGFHPIGDGGVVHERRPRLDLVPFKRGLG